jgi:hypothetical protein
MCYHDETRALDKPMYSFLGVITDPILAVAARRAIVPLHDNLTQFPSLNKKHG